MGIKSCSSSESFTVQRHIIQYNEVLSGHTFGRTIAQTPCELLLPILPNATAMQRNHIS